MEILHHAQMGQDVYIYGIRTYHIPRIAVPFEQRVSRSAFRVGFGVGVKLSRRCFGGNFKLFTVMSAEPGRKTAYSVDLR